MAEKEYLPSWLGKYKYEYWEIPNPDVYTSNIVEDIILLIRGKVEKLIQK
jgi:hypothetical protein